MKLFSFYINQFMFEHIKMKKKRAKEVYVCMCGMKAADAHMYTQYTYTYSFILSEEIKLLNVLQF